MGTSSSDQQLPGAQHDRAEVSAEAFEAFVVAQLELTRPLVEDLQVRLHEVVEGTDGSYDFDATVRFRLAEVDFLVVVEAKRHGHPIKRQVVQTLHSKILSVGAHKGIVMSTAPFQRGALEFARVHGIALVHVTEGRFAVESRSGVGATADRRGEASTPAPQLLVAHCCRAGLDATSVVRTVVSRRPEPAARLLLGIGPDLVDDHG
jgi:hypothetical protein